ncbi:Y' element ATP-dependent helicase [Clostridioides difficile E15]|nr:Y' element ATP-dependent helicase [Clostridioides difficile E15]
MPNQANVVTTTPPKSAPKDIPVSAEMFYCRTALSASTGMPSNAAL